MGLFTSQISSKRMVPVCRQMATSYQAGIPIIQSLGLVANNLKDRKLREILTTIQDDIKQGSTLAVAAQRHSRYLSPFFVQVLAAGEKGGKLDANLTDLAGYYEDQLQMRRKIIAMLSYPLLQLAAAWFLGTFALMMVDALGEAMAGSGGGGVGMVEKVAKDWAIFQGKAAIVFAILLMASVILARLGILKWFTGYIKTFIWPLSKVTLKFALARFFRSMSALIASGVNIVQCIESSAAVVVNPYIEEDLLKSVPHIKNGKSLTESFSNCKRLTPLAREMLAVGEQSGNLEACLKKVSDHHFSEASHAVKVATTFLGVLIMLAIGVLVGGIIIKFYSMYFGGVLDAIGV